MPSAARNLTIAFRHQNGTGVWCQREPKGKSLSTPNNFVVTPMHQPLVRCRRIAIKTLPVQMVHNQQPLIISTTEVIYSPLMVVSTTPSTIDTTKSNIGPHLWLGRAPPRQPKNSSNPKQGIQTIRSSPPQCSSTCGAQLSMMIRVG